MYASRHLRWCESAHVLRFPVCHIHWVGRAGLPHLSCRVECGERSNNADASTSSLLPRHPVLPGLCRTLRLANLVHRMYRNRADGMVPAPNWMKGRTAHARTSRGVSRTERFLAGGGAMVVSARGVPAAQGHTYMYVRYQWTGSTCAPHFAQSTKPV
jgi:hypothetical protein